VAEVPEREVECKSPLANSRVRSPVAPLPPRSALRKPLWRAAESRGALQLEDCDDDNCSDYDLPTARTRVVAVRAAATALGGQEVDVVTLRDASALLWGCTGRAPAGWKQGIYFTSTQGLSYGLEQRAGGPCGVLAVIQATLLSSAAAGSVWRGSLSTPILHPSAQAGDGTSAQLVNTRKLSTSQLSFEQLGLRASRAPLQRVLRWRQPS